MEYYYPIIIIMCSCLWNVLENWMGFRSYERCAVFKNRFILKNHLLKKLVIIKPMQQQDVSLLKFIPYIVTLIQTVAIVILTFIYAIARPLSLAIFLSNKVVFIYFLSYTLINFFYYLVIQTIGTVKFNKE